MSNTTLLSLQPRANSAQTGFGRYVPLVGRVLLGLIFVLSGFSKVTASGPTIGYISSSGLPLPEIAFAVAVLIELGGGLLLLAGYQARIAAAVLAGFSIVTALAFHNQFGDQNQMIHFLKNLAIAGGLLQVVAFGAGAASLDARKRRV